MVSIREQSFFPYLLWNTVTFPVRKDSRKTMPNAPTFLQKKKKKYMCIYIKGTSKVCRQKPQPGNSCRQLQEIPLHSTHPTTRLLKPLLGLPPPLLYHHHHHNYHHLTIIIILISSPSLTTTAITVNNIRHISILIITITHHQHDHCKINTRSTNSKPLLHHHPLCQEVPHQMIYTFTKRSYHWISPTVLTLG